MSPHSCTPGLHTTIRCCIVANSSCDWPVPITRCSVLFCIPDSKSSYSFFSQVLYPLQFLLPCTQLALLHYLLLTSCLAMTVQCQMKVMNRQQNFCSLQGVLCTLLTLLCCNYQTIRVLIMSGIHSRANRGLAEQTDCHLVLKYTTGFNNSHIMDMDLSTIWLLCILHTNTNL